MQIHKSPVTNLLNFYRPKNLFGLSNIKDK